MVTTQSLLQSSFARAINACGIERLCACTAHSSETAFRCVCQCFDESVRCDECRDALAAAGAGGGAAAW